MEERALLARAPRSRAARARECAARLLLLLDLLLLEPPPVAAASCQTFYEGAGLCPPDFGAMCQCTLGESCSAAPAAYGAPPARLRRADGSCAGQCLQVVPGQCPGPASCVANAGACALPPPCVPPPANNTARSVLLTLAHQGFSGDGRPGALVYVPTTFDATARALSLVVFVHGFHNCAANCALPEASGCNCSIGGGRGSNQAYGLIDSFEAAAAAGAGGAGAPVAQSLLVAVEVAYDEASSDPGNWTEPGMFAAFVADVLAAPALAPLVGAPRALADVGRVRVFSHSGGYAVAAALASPSANGNLSAVREVVLLDSLYGSEPDFDAIVQTAVAAGAAGGGGPGSLGPGAAQARFLSVYTDGGGTEANNRAMAARAAGWLRAANESSALLLFDDEAGASLPAAAVAGTPLVFKRSNLTHDDTCRRFFALFLAGEQYGGGGGGGGGDGGGGTLE